MSAGTSRLGAAFQALFGQYNATPPVLADGDAVALQTDVNGKLLIGSPDHSSDASFGLAVWVLSPGVESAPTNLASVPTGRQVRAGAKRGSLQIMGSGGLRCFAVGPATASVTVQGYYYDDTLAAWVPFGIPLVSVVATGTSGGQLLTGGPLIGARLYMQVTAVANAPTAFGYDYF